MAQVWVVTTGWWYESWLTPKLIFDNEAAARRVAAEIDAIRTKYEDAVDAANKLREEQCTDATGEVDWNKFYSMVRDEADDLPPSVFVQEAIGVTIQCADYTDVQGPIEILS